MTCITRVLSETKSKTGTLDSMSKMAVFGCKTAQAFGATGPVVSNVGKAFGGFTFVVGGLNILERAHEWATVISDPEKRKSFTGPKYASLSFLTASHGLEFLNAGHKMGIWNLGAFASEVAPGIVPLEVIKNIFYIPASVCGIWHSFLAMGKQDEKVADWEVRKTKWVSRLEHATTQGAHFLEHIIPDKLQEIGARIDLIHQERGAREPTADEQHRVTRLQNRLARWTLYRDELKGDAPSQTLKEDCDLKIDGYQTVVDNEVKNSGKLKTKEWLSVVNNIGKFVFGILGLVAAFFLAVEVATCAAFVATVAIGWFVTHFFNLAKGLYENREENKIINTKNLRPHLAVFA